MMSQQAKFIEKWIGYLNATDRDMSLIAAQKLGATKDPEVVPALMSALKGRPDDIRIAAARALGDLGSAAKDAVGALIEALADPNPIMASTAADSLGMIGAASAVPALVNVLRDYKEGKTRHNQIYGFDRGLFTAAVFALQRINTPEARRAVAKYYR